LLVALSVVGCVGLLAGGMAAVFASRFPARSAALQDWGGKLVVGGIVLLGFAFAMV
jgi:hypothetical protein